MGNKKSETELIGTRLNSSVRAIRIGYLVAFALIIVTTLYSHKSIKDQNTVQEQVSELLGLSENISGRLNRSAQIVTLVLRSFDTNMLSSHLRDKSGKELKKLNQLNLIDTENLVIGIQSVHEISDDLTDEQVEIDVNAFARNIEILSVTIDKLTSLEADQVAWRFSLWAPLQLKLGLNSGLVSSLADLESALKSRNRASFRELSERITFATILTLIVLAFEIIVIFNPLLSNLIANYKQIDLQNKRLSDAVKTDILTGLGNRNGLMQYLDNRRCESAASLDILLIDIDNFKVLNDVYGHDAGDHSLITAAFKLLAAVQNYGEIFRLGGDEFLVVMQRIEDPEGVNRIAQGIVDEFRFPIEYKSNIYSMFVSVAISEISSQDVEKLTTTELMTAIVTKTSTVLRTAKATGKNGLYRLTDADFVMQEENEKRVIEISQGLLDKQFVPFFQPIVDINSGAMIGSEALARWILPSGEIRYPGDFISLMEENGLIDSLTECILINSYHHYKECADQKLDIGFISVNFPESMLVQDSKPARILDLCGCDRLDWLRIEIVETALLTRSAEVIMKNINEYIRLGARISLDDFGTGFASLSHLKDFPCHCIKIDRTFVSDTSIEEGNNQILNGMIEITMGLNMAIIIEGIETQKQYDYFKKWPGIAGQGYFMAKPMSFEHVREFQFPQLKQIV